MLVCVKASAFRSPWQNGSAQNAIGTAAYRLSTRTEIRCGGYGKLQGHRRTKTFIIDRVGDSVSAHKIAYALGVADSLVRREIDTEEYVKADLVIGAGPHRALNPTK